MWIRDREFPEAYRETLVVLDGTTGQNALSQARQFMEVADITGIILTKLDGTAKGGIAVAIPVSYTHLEAATSAGLKKNTRKTVCTG